MSNQERLQNIWAMTDKPIIDMMTKKTRRSPAGPVANNSSDESSDSESVASSYGSFVAVPKEFRPYLPAHPEVTKSVTKIPLNENAQSPSIQNSDATPGKPTTDTLPKIPPFENQGPPFVGCKQISFTSRSSQNEPRVEDEILSKNIGSHQKCSRDVKNIATVRNTEETAKIEKGEIIKGETSLQEAEKKAMNYPSFQKKSCVSLSKESRRRNRANGLKYECVEKEMRGTIKINFEMPSATDPNSFVKDELIYQTKFAQNVKQQRAAVLKNASKNFRSGTRRDCNKDAHHVLFQQGFVKWDSASSPDDQSSDDGGKIEWTVFQEKKTFVSARKVKDEKSTPKQLCNEFSRVPCHSNGTKKPRRRYRPRRHRNGPTQNETNLNRKEFDAGTPFYKNNLRLNNGNLKYAQAKIRNSDAGREPWNIDNESFRRQCRVSPQNFAYQNIYPNLPNDSSKSYDVNESGRQNYDKPTEPSIRDLGNFNRSRELERSDDRKSKEIEDQKNAVLRYGREMADLIIGSHTALSVFISFYKEWKLSRRGLIDYFEHLEKNLAESSKKFTKYKDIIKIANTSATLASAIPLPHVSIAAKIVSVLTGLFSGFMKSSKMDRAEVEESNEITTAVFKDTHLSTDLYMYGLQCHQQFEETAKLIEQFHLNARNPEFFEDESREIATFIRGVLEFKPNHRIFYKKLHKCFQELIQTSSSDFSRRFCEPFSLYSPTTVEVIGFLDWRFRYEDFNGESVRYELEHIQRLIEDSDSPTSIKDLTKRIQSCIRILRDELSFVERCVKDVSLFDSSPEQFPVKSI